MAGFTFGRYAPSIGISNYLVTKLFHIYRPDSKTVGTCLGVSKSHTSLSITQNKPKLGLLAPRPCLPCMNFVLLCSSSQPFTFSNVTKPDIKSDKSKEGEDDDQPPKVEFTPVTEEGAIYSKRYIPAIFCMVSKIQHVLTFTSDAFRLGTNGATATCHKLRSVFCMQF
jgi:hypothetical protein